MKYIIYKGRNSMETPVLFPEFVNHNKFEKWNPISAGFYRNGEAQGFSHGLNLASRPKRDTQLINAFLLKPARGEAFAG